MRDTIKKILREENDFDWATNQNPISRERIEARLDFISSVGEYRKNIDGLVDVVYNLGLTDMGEVTKLSDEIYGAMMQTHSDAHSSGYDEGREDYEDDCERQERIAYNDGHDVGHEEGYNDGETDGHEEGYKKGFAEAKEVTYHKAFEEGRAYEANLDSEEYEKREGSAYDPKEYNDDHNTFN